MADHIKTPLALTPAIMTFCEHIVPGAQPVYIDVEAAGGARPKECFGNVDTVVTTDSGSARLGWMILEWPGLLLEAQFHSVWLRPDGTMLDVTPHDEARVLFLPDPAARYTGERTPSKQAPLSDAPIVAEYIDACQEQMKFEAEHWVDDGDDVGIDLSIPEDEERYLQLEHRRIIANIELLRYVGELP